MNRVKLGDMSIGVGEYGAASASMPYDINRPRYVRITDINDDGSLNNDCVCSSIIEDDITYKLNYGDFLFARMGATVGKTYAYRGGNQIFAGYLIRFKLDTERLIPQYLFWYTKTPIYNTWVKENQSGAAQPGINAKKYASLTIPLLSLPEQQKIAAHLDSIQSAIDNKKQQLQQLDELVKSKFVEMFGDPIANEMNWTKKIMTDVCPIKEYDFNPSENEWILNLDMIESNTGTILEKVISPLKEIGNSTIKFSQNHVLYSKLRPYLNKVALPDDYGFATSELIPFLPGEEINRIYFATFLRSASFVELINSKSGGAKMPRASMDFLRKFEIPVPPIDLQNTFAEYVHKIDSAKSIIKTQLVDLQELLDSKMDEYFGE